LLAAHIDSPLSRDQVIETLWPDADPTSGLNNLNQTVFQLRRDLDVERRDTEAAPYVVSTAEAVYLHSELVHTDLQEVHRLAESVARGPVAARRRAAAELLTLQRGEFLLDLRYEDWAQALRVRIHNDVRSALRPLLMADGIELDHETGVRAAYALLGMDEYDELARLALIRQLAASGRRKTALEEARRYADMLRSELDEDPPAALLQLINWVQEPLGQPPFDLTP
jgi:DNA-binding SARP family transcriptional activator